MSYELKTDAEVLAKLGAQDFRSITKKQIKEFVSNLDNMSPEVARQCIEQFPEFAKSSTEIVKILKDLCDDAIKSGHIEDQHAIETYQRILDDLRFMLKKDDLSDEMRIYIIDREVAIGNSIGQIAIDHKNFLKTVLGYAGTITGIVLTISGTILGIKLIDKN